MTAAPRRRKASAAGRRRERARLASPGSPKRRHNFPAQLTSFIGRDHEIAEIKSLLETTRLLTLTGAGGSGKTRLALRVAADLLDHYADGVWVIELASLSDPALVPRMAARVLGIAEPPALPLSEVIAGSLRSKSALLIFDNCEHVLPACAALIDSVLQTCPNVRVMTTSREALRNAGEVAWRVPPMTLPGAAYAVDAQQLMKYEGVRLFMERSAAVAPAFAPTLETTNAMARICRRVDGIPLAIELAAARVRALSLEQIAARLDDRFALLTDGSRTAPPRQRTLRATMDWSYDLLSAAERTVFRRLAVFAGGWTLEAAEAVCAGGEVAASQVLGLLAQLIDKSLVIADTREDRYRFLETVRQYAADRLVESGEGSDVRSRHRGWFLELAQRAEAEMLAGGEQERWLERLEAELDNLRSALAWSRIAHDGGDRWLRLATALLYFWTWRDHYREGLEWLQQALSHASSNATRSRVRALSAAAFLAMSQDDDRRAVEWGEESLALSREIGETPEIGRSLRMLAIAVDSQGDSERAKALLLESLAIFRSINDTYNISAALSFLSIVARHQKDYGAALAACEEALALARSCGHGVMFALVTLGLSDLVLDQGDTRRARELFMQAVSAAKRTAFKGNRANCLVVASKLAVVLGRPEEAARLSSAAKGWLSALGGTFLQPFARAEYERCMAGVREALGDVAFNAAAAEGRAMNLEQALEYALFVASLPVTGVPGKRQKAGAPGPGLLTRREREVAILIAQGLSNRAIAARLIISERTAETHIQHIFTKLGVDARAQVAAWVVQHGLMPATSESSTGAGPTA